MTSEALNKEQLWYLGFRHDTLADPVMVEITSGDYYHLWGNQYAAYIRV